MEETSTRLRDSAENCIKAYDTWTKSRKNLEAREALQEALHELRKVSARLEIEMASSERDEMTQRQIPIPSHRSQRRRPGGEGDMPDFITDNNSGNTQSSAEDSVGNSVEGSEGRPAPARQPSQGRMQHRRPMRRPQESQE